MKKIIFAALALAFIACTNDSETNEEVVEQEVEVVSSRHPEWVKSANIYEVNVRQYSESGRLNDFEKELPRLKEMGVDILWFMPIQPIGVKNRKESEADNGSFYSISNYTEVNAEVGTLQDFKDVVNAAHDMGMYVVLDWVANHTAWDHPGITAHPEYYAKDSTGKIVYEADWTDIALLDHTNPETRKAMIDEMAYWITETDIDGYRCDHAGHEIPLYFWEEATAALDPLKDLFWLAEWDEPRMHTNFHASYSWELMHLTAKVASGEKTADDIDHFIRKDLALYGKNAFRMMILTNHDENSWNGTIKERYAEGHRAFAALLFTAYGIPMIYGGQEVGLDKRLRFFEKDTVTWIDEQQLTPFYTQLLEMKHNNEALWNGEFGGTPERINSDENIYAFKRKKGNNLVIGIINLSKDPQTLHINDASVTGSYTDSFTEKTYELKSDTPMELAPWEYLIFEKNN